MVVLAEDTEPSWGVGLAWSLLDAESAMDSLLALRNVDASTLPADVRARAAEPWTLVAQRSECHVHLGTPVLVRRSDGAFIAYDEDATDLAAPVADPTSLEARLWSSGREVLAAPVVVDDGSCADALFASPASSRVVPMFRAVADVDPSIAREARAAFADMAAFQSLQVEYEDYLRTEPGEHDGPTWPEYGGDDSTLVSLLRADDGRELVAIGAHGEEYCGGWSGSLFALFERTPSGLALIDSGPIDARPLMVLDGETPTYVGGERWRRVGDVDESGWPVWHDVSSPWLGCNC
jgi:hypothetical protein